MKSPEILSKLEPWLARQRRPAWKPVVEEGDGPPSVSKFGGVPWIGADAVWPNCGQCKKPLPLFLQLDLGKLPEELNQRFGTGLLQLFYCTREPCQGYGGWETFGDTLSRVRVVQPAGPGLMDAGSPGPLPDEDVRLPAKRIVGWTRFLDLPSPMEHDELGLKYTYDFKAGTLRFECPEVGFDHTNPMNECPAEEIAVSQLGDKLAGWPAWIQGVDYPNCLRCGQRMILVMQLDSEDNIPFMFGDAGCGHVTQCPEHKDVVAFGWACG